MPKRNDTEITLYAGGNLRAQAAWLRGLADVLDRQAAVDGDVDLEPIEGYDVAIHEGGY
jgi:hypothetical protein